MTSIDHVTRDIGETFPDCKVYLAPKDVPPGLELPPGWQRFGLSPEGPPQYPAGWSGFSTEFPTTLRLLDECLLGTVLLVGAEIEMAYIFHDDSSVYYYVGGAPVTGGALVTPEFKRLPARLQDFHREVHDGYTFFPARSMGPQRLCDQSRVSDMIDEEDDSFARSWITVFSNGGGDYVAVEEGRLEDAAGLIWWHESPETPERGIDIFAVMDAWMAMFLEDTRPRQSVASSLLD